MKINSQFSRFLSFCFVTDAQKVNCVRRHEDFQRFFQRANTSLPYLRWYPRKTGSAVIAIVSDMLVARAARAIPHIHEYTITFLNDLLRTSFALI